VVGLLRLVIRMLSRETMVSQLLGSLLSLPSPVSQAYLLQTHQQIASAMSELIQTQASCVKTQRDWMMLLFVLECVGTGSNLTSLSTATWLPSLTSETGEITTVAASKSPETDPQDAPVEKPPLPAAVKTSNAAFLESLSKFDVLVEESIEPHNPDIFFKCCKTLSDLVRGDVHVTATNFSVCVHCIRTFSEVSGCGLALEHEASMGRLHPFHMSTGGSRHHPGRSVSPSRAPSSSKTLGDSSTATDRENQSYTTASLQLLDLMDTLFSRIGRVFTPEAVVLLKKELEVEGSKATVHTALPQSEPNLKPGTGCGGGGLLWRIAWCPLLQGMARMCCDSRKSVRQTGITYLQRALLAHDLQNLTSREWESCFLQVFFPMLSRLLEVTPTVDLFNLEETRVRASNLLCKVFLQHLLSLSSLPHFPDLWFGILDFMEKYLSLENSDLLSEAIPESIKNLLLVMSTQGVLEVSVGGDTENKNEASLNLLQTTWIRIEQFLPGFMNQLFPAVPPPASLSSPSPLPTQAPPVESTLPQSSVDHSRSLEGVVVQEVPVTVDHVIAGSGGGVGTLAARPMQAQCSPSRSPPGTSPHASPPTTSSPVAELQAQGEVSIGSFPVTLHPPLPTLTNVPVSQGEESSGSQQSLVLVQPATQSTPPAATASPLLNL
jgi:brefeldin A-resistance guanine nucleotide exchange factor 1